MKRILFGFTTAALLASGSATAETVLFEDFEDATVTYTTSTPEFSDGIGDFFTRTDGSNTGSFYEVTGFSGSSYFAGMDLDGEGATLPVTQTFSGLDITGLTDLELSVLLAEDDDGSNEDWDASDYVHFSYQIDGGGFQNLLWIANDGETFNTAPRIDTDFDGIGDGTVITSAFEEFTAGITGTGSTLDLQIEWQLNSGDEDLAIDNVTVTAVPEPGSLALLGLGGLLIARRRRA